MFKRAIENGCLRDFLKLGRKKDKICVKNESAPKLEEMNPRSLPEVFKQARGLNNRQKR